MTSNTFDPKDLNDMANECFPYDKKNDCRVIDLKTLIYNVVEFYHPIVIGRNVFVYNQQNGLYEKENNRIKAFVNTLADSVEYTKSRKADVVYNRVTVNLDCIFPESDYPFDRANAIAFNNGVLVFSDDGQSYELKPFSHEYMLTRKLAVDFNPNADRNLFINELGKVWVSEPDVETLYLPLVGSILQALPNHQPVKRVWLFVGHGNSGKSTYLNFLEHCIGSRYVGHLSLQQLCDPSNRFDRFTLIDKFVNIGDDIAQTKIHDVSAFKSLTGTLYHSVEDKGKSKINARIVATTALTANYTPELANDIVEDEAFWRRIHIVPFSNSFASDPSWISTHFRKEVFESYVLNAVDLVVKYWHGLPETDINETRFLWYSCRPPNSYDVVAEEFTRHNLVRSPGSYVSHQAVQDRFCDYVKSYTTNDEKQASLLAISTDTNVIGKTLKSHAGLTDCRPTIDGKRTWCYRDVVLTENLVVRDDDSQMKL